jgi:hypothetical protein
MNQVDDILVGRLSGLGGWPVNTSSASASELVVRETKCNKTEFCVTGECLGETAPRNGLGLGDAGNNHDMNSGM